MSRQGYSMFKMLGVQGKKCDIIPTTYGDKEGMKITEVYNKKFEFLCYISYDKKWKKFVLSDIPKSMQLSKDCILEAFELTEKYWSKKI